MTFGLYPLLFIALDSSAFLFGFGLLLLIFIIICQTPSPTVFNKITTSAANRQDAIVYFTVTLPVPLCVPNPHMQKFCWEREKTKYCPTRIHLINPRHLFILVCKLVGIRRPQVPLVGFFKSQEMRSVYSTKLLNKLYHSSISANLKSQVMRSADA